MRRQVTWTARCMICDWTLTDEVKRCDLDAEKHTKTTGHPTVQEGLPQWSQQELMPIPVPYRPRGRGGDLPHWSRWRGPATSCFDCVVARLGTEVPDTDLLRALWRVEHRGRVALVCSVHASRRWRR